MANSALLELAFAACRDIVTILSLHDQQMALGVLAEEQPARNTPEAEQPIFVYRLLKKKEVNKDLVHQEVTTLLLPFNHQITPSAWH